MLAIILFAPMLLERLRIPSIVGMIFAGLIIGPHGIGLLSRDASFELFGKVGLYYIMFLASLEMNLQDVQRIKSRALVLGLLSFAIPMLIGYAANSWLLGFGVEAAVLMAAMYASHTLIAYPIVMRYGLVRLPGVSIAVGGTIVADTLTLLVLAVVGGMLKEHSTGLTWVWLVIKVILLGLVIIYAFPRLGRWFFRRYNDSVVQYVFVISLVFLGAGLMELVGMEGILGAFLAGIVLNRLIPPTSPLMSHIEFVGNALFIPYFLIGVGMLINLRALFDHTGALVIAAVMVAVGIVSKWLAALATQRIYRMNGDERRLIFGLTGSRAAATLAVVLVGYNIIMPDGSHLLGDDVLNGAMVLILVTCIVSSMLTEHTARRLATRRPAAEAETDDATGSEADRLLVAVKDRESVVPLVSLALLVRTPRSLASIVAINVVLDDEPSTRQQGLQLLEHAEKMAASTGVKMQTFSRWSVNLVTGISHAVKENAVSDLIVGLHRKGKVTDTFYGKFATGLLTALDRQVFIYRQVIPLSTVRRIHTVVPPEAEYEAGFVRWLRRVVLLARQISCAIDFYGQPATLEAVRNCRTGEGEMVTAVYHPYDSWDNLVPIAREVRDGHMAIFVSARKGTISRQPYHDRLPEEIERYFSARNVLVIYPHQPAADSATVAHIRGGVPTGMR